MWFLFVSLFFRTNTMKIKIIAHFFKLSPRLCICCCGVWKTVLGLNDLFLRQTRLSFGAVKLSTGVEPMSVYVPNECEWLWKCH
ncbi:hypothetical protein IscW_ISCW003699 [Ixodes scapularis]|uniref:Uncharacterized protein n=1 Tax=Ixodes scapularis TaxID=6945 RepID=B7PES2_IXOSC|nr:hypothetical protein IscW_ISCW003699 [Ixodes scapularis]|eukprot:XP_002433694.1 hypothetical protein IscW_ISCW003699 [Ixodes scapularis]